MFDITIKGDDQGGIQMTYNGQPVPIQTAEEAMQVVAEVLQQGAGTDPESAAEDQGEPMEAPAEGQGEMPPEEDEEAFANGFKGVRNGGLNGRG